MKNIFKQTKVIYDAHEKEYQVWYRNFFIWQYDSCYRHDISHPYTPQYDKKKAEAEQHAIERAKALLNTVEVWRSSNFKRVP